jgi:hypothetical protein
MILSCQILQDIENTYTLYILGFDNNDWASTSPILLWPKRCPVPWVYYRKVAVKYLRNVSQPSWTTREPDTLVDLRHFLGILSYFRRCIPLAAQHKALFKKLREPRNNDRWKVPWTPAAESAFQNSKTSLAFSSVLQRSSRASHRRNRRRHWCLTGKEMWWPLETSWILLTGAYFHSKPGTAHTIGNYWPSIPQSNSCNASWKAEMS